MLVDLDRQVSLWSEAFARKLNRRAAMGTTVKAAFATVTAVTAGQFGSLGTALAASCTCTCGDCWMHAKPCSALGYPCPTNGCPSACRTCYHPDCSGPCSYVSANWVSCSGLGASKQGYKLCWDCKCPDCQHVCSCLSACIGC